MGSAVLYGSSASMEGIGKVIKAFYCGESKGLRAESDGTWTVLNSDGTNITGTIVRLKKGRYRLEKRTA